MDKADEREWFDCVNLKNYLVSETAVSGGENDIEKLLSTFSCPKNPDVETFLRKNAINFTKKNQSITYLVFSKEDTELVGYFSLTVKPVTIQTEGMSNTVRRKMDRLSHFDKAVGGYTIAAYLIAQLGKNYDAALRHSISGNMLLDMAIEVLQEIQYDLGGLIVYLECEDREALLQFYQEKNGFRRFGERITENPEETEPHRLIQLMNFL